ncbi:MAG: adenylate cyclase [Gemmatimonadaceae bacterium]|nr:adenylate cyclase [Gemmatimonadaceae bacterium]
MREPNLEIERKYLLRALPPEAGRCRSVLIDQGYLPGERIRERVRRISDRSGERYVRTLKLGRGIARQEFEEETTAEVFGALWSVTRGKRLQKRRYFVPEGRLTWEVDDFTDRDLVLAELEIPSVDFRVVIPGWLEPYLIREVTEEKGFGNHELAR